MEEIKNNENRIDELLSLYRSGTISKEALDIALKSLQPPKTETVKNGEEVPKEVDPEKIKEAKKARKRAKNKAKKIKKLETPQIVGKPMDGYFRAYSMNASRYNDPTVLFGDKKKMVISQIKKILAEFGGVKFSVGLSVQFSKRERDGTLKEFGGARHGDQSAVLTVRNIDEEYDKQVASLLRWIEQFTSVEGTGATVEQCIKLYLNIAKYEPIKGSSYIPTPKIILHKMAIVNVQNDDNRCVEWAIKSALYPQSNSPQRAYTYAQKPGLKLDGVDFPTPVTQIPKIEKLNNLAINVYGYKTDKYQTRLTIFPYYISEQSCDLERINLLLITGLDKDGEPQNHYCWIKSLSRLLLHQYGRGSRTYFCDRCLHGCMTEKALKIHREDCKGINVSATRTEMPKGQKAKIKFKNYQNQLPVPYAIYADFEALVSPLARKAEDHSEIISEQVPCGFGYKVVRYDGKSKKPVIYRGPDAVEVFLQKLQEEVNYANETFKNPASMVITPEEQDEFDKPHRTCWICGKGQRYEKDIMVRDHCHMTGKYRGPAHKSCNLKLRYKPGQTKIPVVFHNLRGYDGHLIMQKIHTITGRISCIANNSEKYLSFSLGQLRFVDSIQFFASSLESLAKATPKDEFHTTRREFGEMADLMTRKGVYPYEYIDSFERFDETSLPPIEKFYKSLYDEGISQEDYAHAQDVWSKMGCRNMGDYHDLYLKTDVLLLTDIFQAFRKTCRGVYKLDPLHYLTAPGLAWDALLKKSEIELDLLTDIDMHLFIEKGMRGGISMVSKRHAKANNPYLHDYDESKEKSYIMYYDANNLYGWAMQQALPYSDFEWVDPPEDVENFDVKKPEDKGWILEVDLDYPPELHDHHADYPLAPEKLATPKEWLSDYQLGVLGEKTMVSIKKLVPNVMDKKKYVVHYRNLKFYLDQGLKLSKVHRVLQFNEKPWMKSYIDMNTEMRKLAKSAFEKDFYKLMNNSVFGKTMENLRKRIDIKQVRTDGSEDPKLRKLIAQPQFNRRIKFSDELSAIHMNKTKLVLNKPIYIGFGVLELSKLLMYDYYYNTLKERYGEDCTMMYTDTDSLLVEIKTDDVYKDMAEHKDEYDFSDYPKSHQLYDETNKKIIGKMKDECAGTPINEFIGLKSKNYIVAREDDYAIKKAKGVCRSVIKKQITLDDFKAALFQGKNYRHDMTSLRSKKHNIYLLKQNKATLSPFDSKRYILNDGIKTLPFGYKGTGTGQKK